MQVLGELERLQHSPGTGSWQEPPGLEENPAGWGGTGGSGASTAQHSTYLRHRPPASRAKHLSSPPAWIQPGIGLGGDLATAAALPAELPG